MKQWIFLPTTSAPATTSLLRIARIQLTSRNIVGEIGVGRGAGGSVSDCALESQTASPVLRRRLSCVACS